MIETILGLFTGIDIVSIGKWIAVTIGGVLLLFFRGSAAKHKAESKAKTEAIRNLEIDRKRYAKNRDDIDDIDDPQRVLRETYPAPE